jgi:hypothetical protein
MDVWEGMEGLQRIGDDFCFSFSFRLEEEEAMLEVV